MTQATFGSAVLRNCGQPSITPIILTKDTVLLSGKVNVQTMAASGNTIEVQCATMDYNDVAGLLALAGTQPTLTLPNGTQYTKCVIKGFRIAESPDVPGLWIYKATFVQQTA